MNILGVDWGKSHIGVAIATSPLAEPLITFANTPEVFDKLHGVCEDNNIKVIVIGLPQGKLDEEVYSFGKKLGDIGNFEVIYQDETLTTNDATRALLHKGKSQRRSTRHETAAALILQSYLDQLDWKR